MDLEQEELQFLGFFGIFKEAFNIITSWSRIFSRITVAIIFPLSFIFLAHIEISHLIFKNIIVSENALYRTQFGTPSYSNISDVLTSEWTFFIVFKIVYFVAFVILSLLSTSAVVYTIACIYTAKEITFKKVMSVVPKVWKRLMITLLWNFYIAFVYNFGSIVLIGFLYIGFLYIGMGMIGKLSCFILIAVYLMGLVYLSIVWHIACVVSVLENVYGIQAMLKSKDLIKGKMGIVIAVFLVYFLCSFGIELVYELYVVLTDSVILRIVFGSGCLNILAMLMLFWLVIQTVIYFICKSYHHENIDKSSLADHLEVYLGDYVPLNSSNVQLEQFTV